MKLSDKLSEHVTYGMMIHSDKAKELNIPNKPNSDQITAAKILCANILEPIYNHFGWIPYIGSFYRSYQLNCAVKGSKTSDHMTGRAVDLKAKGKTTNAELMMWIKDNLDYDQLIHEKGTAKEPRWVHVSYRMYGNRKKFFRIK